MVIKVRYKTIGGVFLILFIISTLFLSLRELTFQIDAVSSENQTTLPIIMYHEVKTHKLGKDVISPYELESDFKYLSENNYTTITMTQLIDYVYKDEQLPEKPIILSFDDGYLNNYKYVFPLLKKYNMKIVFSLIGKNTDDFTEIPDNNLDYSHVTWDQLNEMLNSGYFEIQNHTYNMHTCKGRIGCKQKYGESLSHYEKIMMDDIAKFQEKILLQTGKTPNTFTYPYGKFSKSTDAILKKIGFKASLSCKYGINVITKEPEELFGLKKNMPFAWT